MGAGAAQTAVKQGLKWSVHALDRLRPRPRGVTVLIYHRVGGRTPLDVDLPLATFDAQMAALAASGRVRSIDDALDALDRPAPADAAADPVVVTFDDGTADFADHAHPVLERHAIPATLYVATDFVDRGVDFPTTAGRSAGRRCDTAASGLVTIGSHTHTHALLDRLPAAAIADELDRADALLVEHVGGPPHFAYPKAVAGPRRPTPRCGPGSVGGAGRHPAEPVGATDPYRLARSPIQTSDGMRFFNAKVAGGMRLEDTCATRPTAGATGARWDERAGRMTRRLVHVTTTDMSLELLLGPQLSAFVAAGYEVIGVSAPGRYVDAIEARGIRHVPLRHATRSMAPQHDVAALVELRRLFRDLRPDIVHTHNPKPGVYGRIAARRRARAAIVNTVHGLYALPTDRLAKRAVVYGLERIAATASDAELVQNPEDVQTLRRCNPGRQDHAARQRRRPRPLPARPPDPAARRALRAVGCRRRHGRGRRRRPPRVGEGLPGALRRGAGARRAPAPHPVRGRRRARRREGRPARSRRSRARSSARPTSSRSATGTTSTTSTARWTSSCSRRTARASRARRWRPPPAACPSSPPTSAAAARSSTTAAPASWSRPATRTRSPRRSPGSPTTRRAGRDGRGGAREGPRRVRRPDRGRHHARHLRAAAGGRR